MDNEKLEKIILESNESMKSASLSLKAASTAIHSAADSIDSISTYYFLIGWLTNKGLLEEVAKDMEKAKNASFFKAL